MKTIGLISGMSWESTIPYYKIINEEIKTKLGGLHSAKIILYSVDFDEIEKCQSCGNWEKSAFILGETAKKLEMSGADFILVYTNTMHKVYMQIQSMIKIPVIHIADATASELKKRKTFNAGLLGTTNLGAYFISTTISHYDWALKKLKAHRKIVASK